MRKKYLALLLVILGHICVSCPAGSKDDSKFQILDIMSFNIRYGLADDGVDSWENRKGLVSEVIRQHSPDVIGLQEALRFQIDEIRAVLPQYGLIGIGRDGGEEGEYSAILYRTERFKSDTSNTFWLSDTPASPSAHWGNNYRRICTWARLIEKSSGLAFYVYNTHLDHESQPSRENSVRLIANLIQERRNPDPFVLTGDFNAGEDNPAITYLKGKGDVPEASPLPLVDTFRKRHPEAKDVGTFNGFHGQTNGPKIDYIFVTPDIRILDAAIVRTEQEGHYPSDHYPLTARIGLALER